jgi:hypothetical protein
MIRSYKMLAGAAIAAVTVLGFGAGEARAVPLPPGGPGTYDLEDLIGTGDEVVVLDKTFDNFGCSFSVSGAAVTGCDGDITFSIEGTTVLFSAQIVATANGLDGSGGFADIIFTFDVTADGGLIDEVSLDFSSIVTGGAVASITEDVFDGPNQTGNIVASLDVIDPVGPVEDAMELDTPLAFISVRKDINVSVFEGQEDFGSISIVGQDFRQVPEPATLGLLGIGLVGLGFAARRRRHAA